jgi:tRNA-2-methylthio-N6-dimethylallyladenosine synthase
MKSAVRSSRWRVSEEGRIEERDDRPAAHLITVGCQMNEADSEKMAGILLDQGYRIVPRPEEAEVILLNTCSIRDKAEQKVFSLVGRLRNLKRRRRGLILVLAGCLAQKWGERVLARAPGIDAVLGTGRLNNLPKLLREVRTTGRPVVDAAEEWAGEHSASPLRRSRLKAWVNIMYGCENFCTYCVVPSVRGRERSRLPGDVVREVGELAADGYREITLLGQNVNSYGRNREPPFSFPGLLGELDRRTAIPRIRFITSHPKDFSSELIRAVRDLPTVCEAVHLPLQAGGDDVLRRMNRGYRFGEYRRTYFALREAVPGVAITTDIIVGFPGETTSEYRRTLLSFPVPSRRRRRPEG